MRGAAAGGGCTEERTPSFQAILGSRGARGGDQFPRSPMHASSLPSSPSVLLGHAARPSGGRISWTSSGASAVHQNGNTFALIPGDLGVTSARGAFLREGKGEKAWGASVLDPRGIPQRYVWQRGARGASPRGRSPIPRGVCRLRSASAP